MLQGLHKTFLRHLKNGVKQLLQFDTVLYYYYCYETFEIHFQLFPVYTGNFWQPLMIDIDIFFFLNFLKNSI